MKKGFTLAEVLITLGIIGVVAALTMPAVINNTQKKQLEAALKKNYSVLQNAIQHAAYEEGQPINRANYMDLDEFRALLARNLNVAKDCGMLSCAGRDVYKTFDKSINANSNWIDNGQLLLNDGSLLMIENTSSTIYCISVDVNGPKKPPNIWGYDLFTFQLMSDGKLLPMGAPDTLMGYDVAGFCSETPGNENNGLTCAYRAFTEDDYWKNLK